MKMQALKAAFPYTIPIFAGFWFLGLAYGIYANVSGFSFIYPMVMSIVIFGGSLEFVTESGRPVCGLTKEAYDYYFKQEKQNGSN